VPAWAASVSCRFRRPRLRLGLLSRWNREIAVGMFAHSYNFLSRPARILDSSGKVDWEYHGEGGLWLDHLHYLRYWDVLDTQLSAADEVRLLHWLQEWVAHLTFTPRSKALYPPYNASERAFSLGRFLLTHETLRNEELISLIELVIARDLNFVAAQLEYHLGGNHLLKNLMSLAWGVCLFEGKDARRWQSILDKALDKELVRQTLSDGFHYERSPMYHNIALLDLLDVINVAPDGPLRERFLGLARQMIGASKVVTHADGDISFFNDSALDSCPRSVDIIGYGESLCGLVESTGMLPDAGFYVLHAGSELAVIAKFGALGAEEQMGHVHSDLLSFEMSARDHRVFVNSGTSTYYDQPYRDHERSSEAHNTVVVTGYLQCEHWSNFRVAARTKPEDVQFEALAQGATMLAGAVRLLGPLPRARVAREFRAERTGSIEILDTVSGTGSLASSLFHLDPGVRILAVDEVLRRVILEASGKQNIQFHYSAGRLDIEDCLVSRRFNARRPSKKLVIRGWNEPNVSSTLRVKVALNSD
jgi:hypothetical protein